jgi:hypothetical protein
VAPNVATVISAAQKIIERVKDDASLRSEIHAIECAQRLRARRTAAPVSARARRDECTESRPPDMTSAFSTRT